jgi:hypothetical protein
LGVLCSLTTSLTTNTKHINMFEFDWTLLTWKESTIFPKSGITIHLKFENCFYVYCLKQSCEGNNTPNYSREFRQCFAKRIGWNHFTRRRGCFFGIMSSKYGNSAGYCSDSVLRILRATELFTRLFPVIWSGVNLPNNKKRRNFVKKNDQK